MSENVGRIKFEEWSKYAEEDRLAAEAIVRGNGPSNPICFHSQQIAEKYLKAFLVLNDERFEKKHQLNYLRMLCAKIDPTFDEITDDVNFLNAFYVETRYPGDMPEFNMAECTEGLKRAVRIRDFILAKVK